MRASRKPTAVKLYLSDRPAFDDLWGEDAEGDETPLGEQGKREREAIDADKVELKYLPAETQHYVRSLKASNFGDLRACIKHAATEQEMN